jgi:hypothetical protein
MSSRIILYLVLTVLIVAAVMQVIPFRDMQRGDRERPAVAVHLGKAIPLEIPGWRGRDEPLGPSEFIQDEVAKNLNYDEYVNRIYQRGSQQFGIYVGYWSPGRMPVQKVASHTPDRCWTENGWRCEGAEYAYTLPLDRSPVVGDRLSVVGSESVVGQSVIGEAPGALRQVQGRLARGAADEEGGRISTDNRSPITDHRFLKPAQWRRFTSPNGTPQYVLYWHLVGGKLYDYGDRLNARPHPLKWWRDTVAYAFQGSREQYFIRLTSDRPFEELAGDLGFREVVEAVGAVGIGDR